MQNSFLDQLDQQHLDAEWITFVALRDALGIALQDAGAAKREDTLRLAKKVVPTIFDRENSRLQRHWASHEEKEIHEKAFMRKKPFEKVLRAEIATLEKELKQRDTEGLARTHHARLESLKRLLQDTRAESYFEGKLIVGDAELGTPAVKRSGIYYEFCLPAKRGLKIRVTHDTKVEGITGADLVYEHHMLKQRQARVAAVQYKIMRNRRVVPKDERLKSQLSRLHGWYCGKLPCIEPNPVDDAFFRFPRCSAFLRATNAITADSAGMSQGYYMPVCRVLKFYDERPISPDSFDGEVVTQRMFEDLFNSDLLGSRALSYTELEQFYREQEMIQSGDTVSLHVQVLDPAG